MPLKIKSTISSINELAQYVDYSLLGTLKKDPEAKENGEDHEPRQVFSGHYVPVAPTPLSDYEYVAHSQQLFKELGFADSMATSIDFSRLFSGDLSHVPKPMRAVGWATGYALSIFGTEYYQQCPFQTGNGYGDGRAISILEAVIQGKRWEMQLKGGGRTPYCRGADGRAVLRSSVREFLAQEHMAALGVPTSRSLSLYVSKTETVQRPWYAEGSKSVDPDRMISEPVAISTRVAPSFIRVGQIELFARRARKNEHEQAMQQLEMIVKHLIDREYADTIDSTLSLPEQVIQLAQQFQNRLTSLIADWVRVGYCQGNFNSDNCAAGGFTLDYGPFGFCDRFDPQYQPWTGGGNHFAFFNQPIAAERNFDMFCSALHTLLENSTDSHMNYVQQLSDIKQRFEPMMRQKMSNMFAAKLGLDTLTSDLFNELMSLMMLTTVDYTIFFRELSSMPTEIKVLKKSFYNAIDEELESRWSAWLTYWNTQISLSKHSKALISEQMKRINPKYTLREWFLVPAYQQAMSGDYSLLRELQAVMTRPYQEQSKEIQEKYYRLKPIEFSELAGVSHMSCSS